VGGPAHDPPGLAGDGALGSWGHGDDLEGQKDAKSEKNPHRVVESREALIEGFEGEAPRRFRGKCF